MEALSPGHMVVIAVIGFALFFGWRQLPDMARSLGRSMRIFKTEMQALAADDVIRHALQDTVAVARTELSETTAEVRAVPVATIAKEHDDVA